MQFGFRVRFRVVVVIPVLVKFPPVVLLREPLRNPHKNPWPEENPLASLLRTRWVESGALLQLGGFQKVSSLSFLQGLFL